MAVCRVEKNKNYTTMANFHLRDKNLSNKARGLLSTMLSLPESWDYTTRGLAAICKDGVDGITAQLQELEERGYLVRHRLRDDKGRMTDVEYVIYEEPHPRTPDTVSPYTEKPDMDIPDTALPYTEKPAQINKDKRITEESNTDLSSIDSIPFSENRPSVLTALETKRKETTSRAMEIYREIIRENIDYDILCEDMPYDCERLNELVEIITETVCSTKSHIRISGNEYPTEAVRSRLLKLNAEHIRFVFMCLKENTTKIRSIRQYLLAALWNAPTTMDNYYSSRVNHDLYGEPDK